MNVYRYRGDNGRRGVALIIAMIFVALFSALSLGMLTMSSTERPVRPGCFEILGRQGFYARRYSGKCQIRRVGIIYA